MSKKARSKYVLLWEMVYNNPKEVKDTPARIYVNVDINDEIYRAGDFDQWLEKHRNQIARSVIKAIKNKKSKYRCLSIERKPFYSST